MHSEISSDTNNIFHHMYYNVPYIEDGDGEFGIDGELASFKLDRSYYVVRFQLESQTGSICDE